MSDRADDAILRILEKDGRLSFNSLAEQIGLSKTPTWARVQNLEKKKVITGYRAEIDPAAMGLTLHAFVQVTITGSTARGVRSGGATAPFGDRVLHHCGTGRLPAARAGAGDFGAG